MNAGANLALIVAALLLVLLNGFFVAAEFGLVKLRQTRVRAIAKTFGWRGKILARVHKHLDAYLSACQLGITLASLGLGWIGEPTFANLLQPVFALVGVDDPEIAHGIAFFIAFVSISFLHIVAGELAPKSMAIRNPEAVGLWTALPLYGFYWLMYPAIWCLNHSAAALLRMFGLNMDASHDAHYSIEELKLILRSSRGDEQVTDNEWRVLAQALDFRDLEVVDLMRPFSEAIVLRQDATLEENLERVSQHRFSRYPLLNSESEVIGIVHLKDLFMAQHNGALPVDLGDIARPVPFVSSELPATELFRRFQQGMPHFAVANYADGRPQGFLTLDNLLGALVGEIRDEFRRTSNDWIKLDDGSVMGRGSLPIFTLERTLGIDIESENAESVGGLVLWKIGELPKEGQRVEFDRFDIVVKKMNGPRIVLLRVYPHSDSSDLFAD